MLMKLDRCSFTTAFNNRLLASVCFVAIIERIEKDRNASLTDNVPLAVDVFGLALAPSFLRAICSIPSFGNSEIRRERLFA